MIRTGDEKYAQMLTRVQAERGGRPMTLNLARAGNARVPFLVGECLAAQGLAVFPARSRQPLTDAGVYSATCDLNILRRMNWRDADGCGLATGEVNGIDVLDVDVRPALRAAALGDRGGSSHNDGRDGFAELERLGLALPETLTAQTPRNGRHFFLRHVVGSKSCDLCNGGVEWFSDKKLVVVPPAPGRTWLNQFEIVQAPDSLRALVLAARHSHGGDMGEDSPGPLVKPYDRLSNRDVPRDIWFTIKDGMPNAQPRTRRRVRGLWTNLAAKRQDRNKGLNYTAWKYLEFVDRGDLIVESAADLLWYACQANGYLEKDAAKANEVINRVLYWAEL
jgi:hypothetical protein